MKVLIKSFFNIIHTIIILYINMGNKKKYDKYFKTISICIRETDLMHL